MLSCLSSTGRVEPRWQEVHAVLFAGTEQPLQDSWHRRHGRCWKLLVETPGSEGSGSSGASPSGQLARQPPTCLKGWELAQSMPSELPGPRHEEYCVGHSLQVLSVSRYLPYGHCRMQYPSWIATSGPS